MDTNSTVLPPLKAVTATDQGGVLAITASLGIVFGVISLLIRGYVRIECRASFGKDDYAAFLSMVVTLVQTIVVFLAISRGFGEIVADLAPEAIEAWQRDVYVSDVFYLVGMWLTKSSIALLLMRLSRDPIHGVIARVLLVASAVYFLVSVFVVTLRCDLAQPWDLDAAGCATSTFARWAAVTAIDVATEVALFVGGIWLVRDLQLPWRKKSVVVVAYGLRLPVVLAAAVRLYYLHEALYSDDRSLHGILASVCTQVELSYAVIATTMPCLKPFMSALNTQYGGGNTFVLSQTTPNSSALQRSRDTAGGHGSSTFGTSSAKAKAAAVAAAAAVSGAKGRQSTESETRILESKQRPDSDSDLSPLEATTTRTTTAAPPPPRSAARAAKTTSISSSPFNQSRLGGGGGGAQSPNSYVAVTVDITVSEEKDARAAASLPPVSSPTSPTFPYFTGGHSGGHRRIGEAE